MKRLLKLGIGITSLLLGVVLISSCTASFCSTAETARMMYAGEPGVSQYVTQEEAQNTETSGLVSVEQVFADNPNLYRIVSKDENGGFTNSAMLTSIISSAKQNGIYVPTDEYFTKLDTKFLELAISIYNNEVAESTPTAPVRTTENSGEITYLPVSTSDITSVETNTLLKDYGYLKFYGTDELLWVNYEVMDAMVKQDIGIENSAITDFMNLYTSTMTQNFANSRSCIATITGEYGSYGENGTPILIQEKTWRDAWSKGPIEGLLVYPVAYLLDTLTMSFGGVDQNSWIQLAALFVVTIIVRTVLLLATFWSTIGQQKMQALQPEIAKIQAKYPNANTNQSERMRMSQETSMLYKKNKVRPFVSLLVMVIQFPIFIGVWGAISGAAVLSTGTLLNLQMSTSLSTAFFNFSDGWATNIYGFWTAIVIFIIMAGTQFVSMKLPQWLNAKKNKKVQRLTKNPTQDQQNKTMKIVSWVMLIMIIVMGVTLPAAMAIYWIFGAIYSVIQTLIVQLLVMPKLMEREKRKKQNR